MRRPTSAANYSARAAGSCSCSRSRARRNGCCSLTADSSSPRSAPPPGRSSLASPTWSPIWRHSPATPSCEEQNVSKYPEVKPADEIGVSADEMQPDKKRPLNIFEFPLQTWEEFCAIKMLGDLAEILQVEDLLHCSYLPLRNVARITMPEERFHAQFGLDFCGDLCETREGKARVQDAVNRFYPGAPRFFGSSGSKNNAIFRKYGIKMRKNEEMRDDYMARAKDAVDKLGLRLPEVPPDA